MNCAPDAAGFAASSQAFICPAERLCLQMPYLPPQVSRGEFNQVSGGRGGGGGEGRSLLPLAGRGFLQGTVPWRLCSGLPCSWLSPCGCPSTCLWPPGRVSLMGSPQQGGKRLTGWGSSWHEGPELILGGWLRWAVRACLAWFPPMRMHGCTVLEAGGEAGWCVGLCVCPLMGGYRHVLFPFSFN